MEPSAIFSHFTHARFGKRDTLDAAIEGEAIEGCQCVTGAKTEGSGGEKAERRDGAFIGKRWDNFAVVHGNEGKEDPR